MTIQNIRTDKSEVAIEPGALSSGELDTIGGGALKGYHECVLGSAAGGGPGLYPTYVACRMK
jgi:hypothetical protein